MPLLTGTITNVHAFIDRHLTIVPLYFNLKVTLSMNLLPGSSDLCVIVLTAGRQTFELIHRQFDNCRYYWYRYLVLV